MNDAVQPEPGKRNFRTLWILMAVFAVPYAAAMVLYFGDFGFLKGKTSNYGELISPVRPLGDITLQRLDGSTLQTADLQPQWVFISAMGSACGEVCRANLYKMRQIRLALAEDRTRVQRMVVLLDTARLEEFETVLPEYTGMDVVVGPRQGIAQLLDVLDPAGTAAEGGIYLLDPLGNLMMSYPADADPEKMLKDMQRLMMVSQVG